MGSQFNVLNVSLRFMTSRALCFLLLLKVCLADLRDDSETCTLTPEHGTSGIDTIRANTSIAIATTVLKPPPTLSEWLDYHLRWVQHVVIYMDSPDERSAFDRLCADRPVTLLNGSQVEPQMTPESRLIERQIVNMGHAISYLMDRGYTWLLHIDLDELLHGPLVESLAWAETPGVGLVTFTNHEAMPVDFETSDPFRDCVHFWVNGVDRNSNFMAYGNGKSAVRLGPGVEPSGAHSFSGYTGRRLAPSGAEAMVLHYPYPSLGSWRRKFSHYGRFSDHWFGDRRAPKIMEFMRRSRDVVQKAHETGDWAAANAFFEKKVLDASARDKAIAKGRVRRYSPFEQWERTGQCVGVG